MQNTPTFRVMLRVYSDESDLDVEKARRVLRFDSSDSTIKSSFVDEDEEVFAIEFASPTMPGRRVHDEAREAEKEGDFKTAVAWLRSRSDDSFQELSEMGLAYDLFVEGYVGRIHVDLLRELARLGIGLWIAPIP